jgi:hypothetical protein
MIQFAKVSVCFEKRITAMKQKEMKKNLLYLSRRDRGF